MRQAPTPVPSIRARGQVLSIAGALLVTLFTLGSAGAQMISGGRLPSQQELMADELAGVKLERRLRIAELQAAAPHERCHPPTTRELARLLVMDGQGIVARRIADAYEERCGDDPIVRKWANAPLPRPRA